MFVIRNDLGEIKFYIIQAASLFSDHLLGVDTLFALLWGVT